MTIRTFNLLLILPPCLALGCIFVATLLLFERNDIYQLQRDSVRDETHIVTTFLNAQNFTDSLAAARYLSHQLEAHQDFIARANPGRQIALISKVSKETLFVWPNSFTPSLSRESLQTLLNEDEFSYFDGKNVFSFPPRAVGSMPLQLQNSKEKVRVLLFAPNPKMVYLEKALWLKVAQLFFALLLIGALLAEGLTRFLNLNLKKLRQQATAIHQRKWAQPITQSETPVIELNNLAASLETLRQCFRAVREQNANLAEEANLLLTEDKVADAYRRLLGTHNQLNFGNIRITLFQDQSKNVSNIAFLKPFGDGAIAVSATAHNPLQPMDQAAFIDFLNDQFQPHPDLRPDHLKEALMGLPQGLCAHIRIWHFTNTIGLEITAYSMEAGADSAQPVLITEQSDLRADVHLITDGPELDPLLLQKLLKTQPDARPALLNNMADIHCQSGKGNLIALERLMTQ